MSSAVGPVTVGILTVSDRCFLGETTDASGPKLEALLYDWFPRFYIRFRSVVPDDKAQIKRQLLSWVAEKCDIILTTGGTGFAPRDVTPEATKAVIEREAPGLMYAMTSRSMDVTPKAMLSRAVAGIRGRSIIINLPGSPKGAGECLRFVKDSLKHAVDCLRDDVDMVAKEHGAQGVGEKKSTASKVSLDNVAARPRKSTYPLVEMKEASDLIREVCQPLNQLNGLIRRTEVIPIEEACNRLLVEDISAVAPVPPFDVSIKDGYAVLACDGAGNRTVVSVAAAGDAPREEKLRSGEAMRICTGAPIPEGADAVVQVEDTEILFYSDDKKEESTIKILKAPSPGQDIRPKGADMKDGDLLMRRGERLKAAHLGILASIGIYEVYVSRKPLVGIMSTGNELVDHLEKPEPGQIRDSNRLTLKHLLDEHHFPSADCGIVRDDPNFLKRAIERNLAENEVLVTTGGVSMGEFDLLKDVLVKDFDAKIHFGRVNMKPGKPTTFASLTFQGLRKFVFALPGNPVSACVTCLLFVVPALKSLEGDVGFDYPRVSVKLSEPVNNGDIRPEYARVRIEPHVEGTLRKAPEEGQLSSRLNSMVGANALLWLSAQTQYQPGSSTEAILFSELYH